MEQLATTWASNAKLAHWTRKLMTKSKYSFVLVVPKVVMLATSWSHWGLSLSSCVIAACLQINVSVPTIMMFSSLKLTTQPFQTHSSSNCNPKTIKTMKDSFQWAWVSNSYRMKTINYMRERTTSKLVRSSFVSRLVPIHSKLSQSLAQLKFARSTKS